MAEKQKQALTKTERQRKLDRWRRKREVYSDRRIMCEQKEIEEK